MGRPAWQQRSFTGGNPQVPISRRPGSGLSKSSGRSSEASGRMLSMTYSESVRSGINRYHSEPGLSAPRPAEHAQLQRQREQRAAMHLRNMEDFLKMHGLSLEECVSYQTGMKYR